MITSVTQSTQKGKRYKAVWNGKIIHFGSRGGYTFIDGADEKTRQNYWKRHMGNHTERARIVQLTPSASVLSGYLLWGKSRDLETNLKRLNELVESSQ